MTRVFAMSAYQTSAREFFERLEREHAQLLLDVRLKNTNQLAGFTKKRDLEYLVPRITGAAYEHNLAFAPEPGMLDDYLKKRIDFDEYASRYERLMAERGALRMFRELYGGFETVALLGTATKARRSHAEVLERLLREGAAQSRALSQEAPAGGGPTGSDA